MVNETNSMKFSHYFLLWFGAAVSVAEILAGGLLAPLGGSDGLSAVLLGHFLGASLLVLGGIIGVRERVGAIASTRISFGAYGARLFGALNVLQLVGWTAIMIISAARSANEITKTIWSIDSYAGWSLGLGGLIMLWIALGRESGWKKVNAAAVALLFGLTVALSVVLFKETGTNAMPVGGEMTFGEGVELSVVMPLSWLPLIADYTRFAHSARGAVAGSWLGYFIGSCWMYIIGLGAALLTGSADPSGVMLAANLGMAALEIIVLATVTTTFMDAYSAGVSFTTLIPGLNEKYVALIMTAIGTVLALVVNMEQYENFLLAIGSVFAPLFAVLLTDYFILGKRSTENGLLANWSALAVWAVGVALYYQFLEWNMVLGATVPVIIVTGLLHSIVERLGLQWMYCQKSQKSW